MNDATETTSIPLVLIGFGRVGQAFAALLLDRRDDLSHRYRLNLQLVGITTSRAFWVPADDFGLPQLLAAVRQSRPLPLVPHAQLAHDGLRTLLAMTDPQIVVDTAPASLHDGEPGLSHLREVLCRGKSMAVASKAALARHLPEMRDLAARTGARLRFGAATAAALPILDVARYGLTGASVLRVEGILTGTTNLILSKMATDGVSFDEALRDAQSRGIAEPDPTLDVEGWDTAAKLVLLAHALWATDLRLSDVAVRGITHLTASDLTREPGTVVKLIGSLWCEEGRVRAAVEPRPLPLDHPLAQVKGAEKGVQFVTDTMDRITVIGGRSDPRGAAAALLRDVIHLAGRA